MGKIYQGRTEVIISLELPVRGNCSFPKELISLKLAQLRDLGIKTLKSSRNEKKKDFK